MRSLLATLLTIPALYGLSVLIEYAITGISRDFGNGFTAGVALMAFLHLAYYLLAKWNGHTYTGLE